jgi:tetratricopeptide (TPR) repeat protein
MYMKKLKLISLLLVVLLSVSVLVSWTTSRRPVEVTYGKPAVVPITMCGTYLTDWSDTTLRAVKLLPGLGTLHYKITTKSADAQAYFNQGLRLVYAFNHWEAIQAFRESVRLDPECAMGYWGLALAYGPNLNDINPTDREKIAFESIQKAIRRKTKISDVERGLVEALATRYDGSVHTTRDSLNSAYADAMIALDKKYPNEPEVRTLCADAIMNTMPWDYWLKDGSAKPATQQAKTVLETVLKKFPNHPGAHHLYIHLLEASPNPDQAIVSAQFLESAMPGAGHLVHMPAHIYVRVGEYEKSISSNERAVMVDEEYLSNSANKGMYRSSLYPHNVDFISYSAYLGGRSNLAIHTALKLSHKGTLMTLSNSVWGQYLIAEPFHAYVRFGKWGDILSSDDCDDAFIYAKVISVYAKGMASLRTGNLPRAERYLAKLDSMSRLDTLSSMYFSFNPVSEISKIPLNILKGEMLIKQGKVDAGIAALHEAVVVEDNLRYNEPPDWKIPSRHYLGAALYDMGKFADAEIVFLDDLKRNRENGWALKGLMLAQEKLGKKTEAAATRKRFSKAWRNADVEINSSRF